jgi:hypothetical protein
MMNVPGFSCSDLKRSALSSGETIGGASEAALLLGLQSSK